MTILAVPSSLSIFFSVRPMSPISCPESSTVPTSTIWGESVSCDSWKLVETSLTTDSGGCVDPWFDPVMRTTQRAASHDGGETS